MPRTGRVFSTLATIGMTAGAFSRFAKKKSEKVIDLALGHDLYEDKDRQDHSTAQGKERGSLSSEPDSLERSTSTMSNGSDQHPGLRRSDSNALYLYSERVMGAIISPTILFVIIGISLQVGAH